MGILHFYTANQQFNKQIQTSVLRYTGLWSPNSPTLCYLIKSSMVWPTLFADTHSSGPHLWQLKFYFLSRFLKVLLKESRVVIRVWTPNKFSRPPPTISHSLRRRRRRFMITSFRACITFNGLKTCIVLIVL